MLTTLQDMGLILWIFFSNPPIFYSIIGFTLGGALVLIWEYIKESRS